MKIQIALNRVDLEKKKAESIAEEAEDYIDIIEVGTSLI